MLAILGHVDMAFPYAFRNTSGTPQTQAVRNPLELVMRGQRVGLAADTLSLLWSSRSAQLSLTLGSSSATGATPGSQAAPNNDAILQMILARDDARNYILLGDPAARLRVADLN
jgi:hypothetical protein